MREHFVEWEGLMCEAIDISQGLIDVENFDIIRYTGKSADFAVMKKGGLEIVTELERAKSFLSDGKGVLVEGKVLYMKGVTAINQYNLINVLKGLVGAMDYKELMLYQSLSDKRSHQYAKSRLELFEMGIYTENEITSYLNRHMPSDKVKSLIETWTQQKVAI